MNHSIKILLTSKIHPGICLGCAIFLQVTFFCSSALANETGLMASLGLEGFSPDQSEWSGKARASYERTKDGSGEPLAVLEIERLNITAPVYEGTRRITLDRGLGLVELSPLPGEVGNIAMSGHRDGFFRALKDIKLGDIITLHTLDGDQDFLATEIKIVDALDVSVLSDSDTMVLTLITCYPFYYVGYAPDRYIVKAIPVDNEFAHISTDSARSAASAGTGGTIGISNASD